MGSPQIRNLATIGGNIVNAGAAADIVSIEIENDLVKKIEFADMLYGGVF